MEKERLNYFCILSIILLSLGMLPAQEPEPLPPTLQSAERDILIGERGAGMVSNQKGASFSTILRMILALALAAAAIYGIVFFLKRISRTPEQTDPHLKVLAGVHLGSNRFVHVVSVGSQAWLVGASEGGVSLISEIGDPETVDAMLLEASRKSAETGKGKLPDFARLLSRFGGGEPLAAQTKLNLENVRKRRERLRGL